MRVVLVIYKVRWFLVPFVFLLVIIFPLFFRSSAGIPFRKHLGAGPDGALYGVPDFKTWAFLFTTNDVAHSERQLSANAFIKLIRRIATRLLVIKLVPVSAHGSWAGVQPFVPSAGIDSNQPVAVLTRATVRPSKWFSFKKHVAPAAVPLAGHPGLLLSAGIGEYPILQQCTFSVWRDIQSVTNYAYNTSAHKKAVELTRSQNWYSEELFARFRVEEIKGTYNNLTF